MIIKRKRKAIICGNFGTILTEACTLMFEIRRALQRSLPDEAVEKAMQYIALATQSKNESEHIEKLQELANKEGGEKK